MVWSTEKSFIYSFPDLDSGDSLAPECSQGPALTCPSGAASIVSPQSSAVRVLDLENSSHMGLRCGDVRSGVPMPPVSCRVVSISS